jgi:hypothetical protein
VIAVIAGGIEEAGTHDIAFNASGICQGVYFVDLTAGNYSVVRKVIIAK